MGQKVHPNGIRVGVIKDWNSKWYADSKNFADYLVEDQKIRKFLKKKLYTAGISKIEIERTAKFIKVNVFTAKPGIIIGIYDDMNLNEDWNDYDDTDKTVHQVR